MILLDKNQETVSSKFTTGKWLSVKSNSDKLIEWTTFFRRNICAFAATYLGLSLYPYQTILLYLMGICQLFVLVAARASAKSYIIAIYACCRAILYPGSQIVIASATKGQAKLIVSEKISNELLNMSPNLRREIKTIRDNENEVHVVFKNGSIITVIPALEGARGHRATLLICEEFRQIKKSIVDSILTPFLMVRHPLYFLSPEYSNNTELIEEPQEIYISSSWLRDHWMWGLMKIASENMITTKTSYLVGMDYAITLEHNIRTPKQLEREKDKLDPMSWEIEYCNFMLKENTHSYFSYKILSDRQVLKKAFYPRSPGESLRARNKHAAAKQEGELRVLVCDIALMDGRINDNSSYSLLRLLPETTYSESDKTNQFGYHVQIPYMESHRGADSLRQVIRIKQLMSDFEVDYLVLDTRNAGLGLYDIGARVVYDDERDVEYAPWLAMNNPDIAKRINANVDVPNVYCITANAKLNSDIAVNFRRMLTDGRVDFLVNIKDAADVMATNFPEYVNADANTQLYYETPYLETMLMVSETNRLEYERLEQTGAIRIREHAYDTKDRYTSVSYGCYFASIMERDLINSENYTIDQMPVCVSEVTFD